MTCIICGKEIKESKYSNAVLCSSECFHVDYWNEKIEDKDNPNIVRIDGTQYYIGKETGEHEFKGYGGRTFGVKFFDGRLVKTTCLWHNGEIPEEYKELLPNNAKFIESDNVRGFIY